MRKHALLSASSSLRWLNCTPSARLETQFTDTGSTYAAEGTAAHSLAEHKLKRALKRRSRRPVSDYDCDEMEECTDDYVSYVLELVESAGKKCADPVVLIEQHLDYSRYVEGGFGTGDCIIVADEILSVIDFKYGKGIAVEAEKNPQMMLYALGALELFDALYEIARIQMTIFQPRLEVVSTWKITVIELMDWVKTELVPRAVLAAKGEGDFIPGRWCRFCKARNQCRARAEEYLKLAQMEFRPPALLTEDEIAWVLSTADELAKWSADIYAYAASQAITHGKQWNGFKLVEGRSNRKYSSEEDVARAAGAAGYKDIYKQSLIGITEMERLMGKKRFNELLGDLIYKPAGKITLVPESDRRPPVEHATPETDFSKNKGE